MKNKKKKKKKRHKKEKKEEEHVKIKEEENDRNDEEDRLQEVTKVGEDEDKSNDEVRDTVNYELTKEEVGSIIDANTSESTEVNMANKDPTTPTPVTSPITMTQLSNFCMKHLLHCKQS